MKNYKLKLFSKLKNAFFRDDYTYIYYDNYLNYEKRLVAGNINFNKGTPLCDIMINEGSDKAGFVGQGNHNYTPLYHKMFKSFKCESFNLFELGIGTKDLNLLSNMGDEGVPGASLYGWRNYFKNVNVYAADIDRNILFTEDRITTCYCDQTNSSDIVKMWQNYSKLKFKVIIDDGLHEFNANKNFLENSLHMLEKSGIYIIEDVLEYELDNWKNYLLGFNHPIRFTIVKIPNPLNPFDNNLVLIEHY